MAREQSSPGGLMRPIDRRDFLKITGLGGASLALVACTPAATASLAPSAAASAGTGATPAPSTGQATRNLVTRVSNRIREIDPGNLTEYADFEIAASVMEGLVQYRWEGTTSYENVLAETFELSEDGTKVDFTLKKGIQFHGGYGEVTAEDVKFTYERNAGMTTPEFKTWQTSYWADLDHVEVTDTYSGTIVLKQASAPFMVDVLPNFIGMIVSKKAFEEFGAAKFTLQPIGTGPYEIVTPGTEEATLRRFADWGRASEALYDADSLFDEIKVTFVEDNNAAGIAFENKELDFIAADAATADRLEGSGYTSDRIPSNGIFVVDMNMKSAKLGDLNVRKAIRLAVDAQAIAIALGGSENAGQLTGQFVQSTFGVTERPVLQRDVEQAKQLIAASSFGDTTLNIHSSSEGGKAIAEVLQANLAEAGIKTEIILLDQAALHQVKNLGGADHDLSFSQYGAMADPSGVYVKFTSAQIGVYSPSQMTDPTLDGLVNDLKTESDQAKREAIYDELEQILEDQAPSVPLFFTTYSFVSQSDLKPSYGVWMPNPVYQAFKSA